MKVLNLSLWFSSVLLGGSNGVHNSGGNDIRVEFKVSESKPLEKFWSSTGFSPHRWVPISPNEEGFFVSEVI